MEAKKRMRILAAAEPQGFGLASTLLSITTPLSQKGIKIDYMVDGTALEFIKKEGGRVVKFKSSGSLDNTLSGYDAILSVNNSNFALSGKKAGLPVIYIDLLFWLWPLHNDITDLYNKSKKIASSSDLTTIEHGYVSYDEAFLKQRALNSIMAHVTSDITFINNFPPVQESPAQFFNKNMNIHLIPPIIDAELLNLKNPHQGGEGIIFNLGGLTKQNSYADVIAEAIALLSGKEKITVATSKENFNISEKVYCALFNKKELFERIAKSNVVITPPGTTSTMEAFILKKPIIFLPPQNWGQAKALNMLNDLNLTDLCIRWSDIYQDISETINWSCMHTIKERMTEDKALPTKLSELIESKIKLLRKNKKLKTKIVNTQSKFMEKIGYSDGFLTEKILDFISNV